MFLNENHGKDLQEGLTVRRSKDGNKGSRKNAQN